MCKKKKKKKLQSAHFLTVGREIGNITFFFRPKGDNVFVKLESIYILSLLLFLIIFIFTIYIEYVIVILMHFPNIKAITLGGIGILSQGRELSKLFLAPF